MFVLQNPDASLSAADVRALAKLLCEAEILPDDSGKDGPTTTFITIEHRQAGDQAARSEPSVAPRYLTTDDAAAYCRRSRKTILNHHSLGNIRSMPGTRPPLFRREDLDRWLSTRRRFRVK